jgi:hypothetical protein
VTTPERSRYAIPLSELEGAVQVASEEQVQEHRMPRWAEPDLSPGLWGDGMGPGTSAAGADAD